MNRKKAVLAAIVALSVAATVFWWMKKEKVSDQKNLPSRDSQAQQSPAAQQEKGIKLEGMKYTEVSEDGRTRWKVIAREVEVFLNERKSVLKNVEAEFYLKDGRIIRLSADRGLLFAGVKNIEVFGNVVVKLPDGMVLNAEKVVYRNQDKELLCESSMRFSSPDLKGEVGRWKYSLEDSKGYGDQGVKIEWKRVSGSNSRAGEKKEGKASF